MICSSYDESGQQNAFPFHSFRFFAAFRLRLESRSTLGSPPLVRLLMQDWLLIRMQQISWRREVEMSRTETPFLFRETVVVLRRGFCSRISHS